MKVIISDNMRACVVSGHENPLGSSFSFRDGCFLYNCQCHSDGSWECPADRAEDLCTHDRQTTDPHRTREDISSGKCEYLFLSFYINYLCKRGYQG